MQRSVEREPAVEWVVECDSERESFGSLAEAEWEAEGMAERTQELVEIRRVEIRTVATVVPWAAYRRAHGMPERGGAFGTAS